MIENIVNLIKNNQKFVITSHVNPDGDSIGSELALYYYLKKNGKKVNIINYSQTPINYKFLDKNIIEKYSESKHNEFIREADAIFILDTNEYKRIKTMAKHIQGSTAKKVCIDHHLDFSSDGFDFYYTDTESPSTGELLYKIFSHNGGENINKDIADALYTAVMTDTGSFRFPRTDSETHRIAANLIEQGADPVKIYNEVYEKSSFGRLKLLSLFLNNTATMYDGKLMYSVLHRSDFEKTATNELDTEGFSHHLLSIGTVQLAIIFTEVKNGIKVSFRSKGNIFSNEIAKKFGGGGHQNAAGAWMEGKELNDAIDEVLDAAENFIRK